ncbi:Homoserine O-acetyltransferase [Candidatus Hydrogenisulfobacillus filiaventi]|uniref:Homoserine O-acetyltransferase n=1 Tax=Candidatus Hydrogenisulfobacillus filiaventi TaxID=2707344 RepID=A0A6F8ZF32_9FIRM|nr:homoserine O-acetyltransferase [Bacillota bacterium]CAB1128243.1 Homoserine O-acetyltransferase [Candidatus Hydrogenisulfobacillus filiaventi]
MAVHSGWPASLRLMGWHRHEGFPYRDSRFLTWDEPLTLDNGAELPGITLCYEEWGDREHGEPVLVFHALTGDSHVARHAPDDRPGWWEGILGPGETYAFDPARHYVLAANTLGGVMGSTGPASLDPAGRPWGSRFPRLSLFDMVRAEARLLDALGVRQPLTVVGASMGGMKALAFAALYPERTRRVVAIGAPVRHSPWAIAYHTVGRQAVETDPDFAGGDYYDRPAGPERGLALARMADMISYRSPAAFQARFGRRLQPDRPGLYQVSSYLLYQGGKLVRRFDANSYLVLTRAMDDFDLAEHGVRWTRPLPVLMVGISSDMLYPPAEIEEAAHWLTRQGCRAEFTVLQGIWGHDTFLVDVPRTVEILRAFLEDRPA